MIEYTPFYPPEIKPVRKGLYIIKASENAECWFVGRWDGAWYSAESRNNKMCHALGATRNSGYYWLGLTGDPSQSDRRIFVYVPHNPAWDNRQ